ncbi:hypothetical protein FACS1894200_01080 [Spirochaetia bacterium]|nr:hypothetical protein FACS1894200_01080 [Spirochaetia bacterium]
MKVLTPIALALVCLLSIQLTADEMPESERRLLERVLSDPQLGGERETWGIRFKSDPAAEGPIQLTADEMPESERRLLERVLSDPQLGEERETWGIRFKSDPAAKESPAQLTADEMPESERRLLERVLSDPQLGEERETWGIRFKDEPAAKESPAQLTADEMPESERRLLEQVLSDPQLGEERETWGIRFKSDPAAKESPAIPSHPAPWMENIRLFLGYALRTILVAIFIAFLIAASLYLYRKQRARVAANTVPQTGDGAPSHCSPQSLLAAANTLYAHGQRREAWAACLNGTIAAFTQYWHLRFPAGSTEYGCVSILRSSSIIPSSASQAFGVLVGHWVAFVYAGIDPPQGAFEAALQAGWSLVHAKDAPHA